MLLCLFVFESLGTLDVSHLRRSIAVPRGQRRISCRRLHCPKAMLGNEHFAN